MEETGIGEKPESLIHGLVKVGKTVIYKARSHEESRYIYNMECENTESLKPEMESGIRLKAEMEKAGIFNTGLGNQDSLKAGMGTAAFFKLTRNGKTRNL